MWSKILKKLSKKALKVQAIKWNDKENLIQIIHPTSQKIKRIRNDVYLDKISAVYILQAFKYDPMVDL